MVVAAPITTCVGVALSELEDDAGALNPRGAGPTVFLYAGFAFVCRNRGLGLEKKVVRCRGAFSLNWALGVGVIYGATPLPCV